MLITSSSSSAKHAIHLGERQVLGRNENFFSLSLTPLLQPNILGQLLVPLDVLEDILNVAAALRDHLTLRLEVVLDRLDLRVDVFLGIDPSPAARLPIG